MKLKKVKVLLGSNETGVGFLFGKFKNGTALVFTPHVYESSISDSPVDAVSVMKHCSRNLYEPLDGYIFYLHGKEDSFIEQAITTLSHLINGELDGEVISGAQVQHALAEARKLMEIYK